MNVMSMCILTRRNVYRCREIEAFDRRKYNYKRCACKSIEDWSPHQGPISCCPLYKNGKSFVPNILIVSEIDH